MRQKKIPMRMCSGCGEMKPKRELVRVVKAPDVKDEEGNVVGSGEISLDLTGKKSGRGAYICRSLSCLQKARKSRKIEKAFSCRISDELYNKMEEEISQDE